MIGGGKEMPVRTRRAIARLFTGVLLACSFCGLALAQTPIPGNYAPNAASGIKSGILAPGGTRILENGTLFYNTDKFVDSGGNELNIPTTNGLGNRTIIGYVTKRKFLGANYNPAIIVVFANQLIRPVPGSRKDFQLGDSVIQPLALGWHKGEWHTTASYALFVPIGRFNAGASNNTGKGLYSNLFTVGTTWLQDDSLPWAVNATVRYETFGKQDDTDIRPGDVMTVEFGLGKELTEGFDLGLLAFASFQTSQEKGSAPGTDAGKYEFYGIGPEINWRPKSLPGFQAAVRVGFEFDSRNSSQGTGAILSLAYGF